MEPDKKKINAGFFAQRAVLRDGSRIFVEILPGAELGGIHKYADNNNVVFGARRPNETEMPFMERSHGGDESDRLPLTPE